MRHQYRTVMELNVPYAKKRKVLQMKVEKGRWDGIKEYRLLLTSTQLSTHPSLRKGDYNPTWSKNILLWKSYRRRMIEDFIYSHR